MPRIDSFQVPNLTVCADMHDNIVTYRFIIPECFKTWPLSFVEDVIVTEHISARLMKPTLTVTWDRRYTCYLSLTHGGADGLRWELYKQRIICDINMWRAIVLRYLGIVTD